MSQLTSAVKTIAITLLFGIPFARIGAYAADPVKERTALVNQVLDDALASARKIPDDAEYALVCVAVTRAQTGDTEKALAILQKPGTTHLGNYATKCNMMRRGFLDVAKDLAEEGKTRRAMEMISAASGEWADFRNDAYGVVAVACAERGDEKGANDALAHFMVLKGGYNVRLDVAAALGKKTEVRRLLKEQYEGIGPIDAHGSGKAWRYFTAEMTLLNMVGGKEDADKIVDRLFAKDKESQELKKAIRELVDQGVKQAKESESEKPSASPVSEDGDEPPLDPKTIDETEAKAREAIQLAAAGRFDAAADAVTHVQHSWNRGRLRSEIAAYQAAKGEFAAAFETVKSIEKDGEDSYIQQDNALRRLAIKQAKSGDKSGASAVFRRCAKQIGDGRGQRWVLWAWARHGNVDDAIAWAKSLDDPETRALAYVGIARGLLHVHQDYF
jgi:hypothetical protein